MLMSRLLLWAFGAPAQWGPSDVWNMPQNCPIKGGKQGYSSTTVHSLLVEGCSWGVNAPGIPI